MQEYTKAGKEETCTLEAILFDFGGVLAEEGFRNGLMAIAGENGLDPAAFFETAADLIHRTGYVTGQATEECYWETVRRETGILGDDASFRRIILDHFVLRGWMMDTVKILRNARVRLAILSDQTDWLDELNERYDFFRWFDQVFNSYHAGKSKRDPTLFQDVLAALHVEPNQALFVDDNHGNIERAGSCGLHVTKYVGRKAFEETLASFCPFLRTFLRVP